VIDISKSRQFSTNVKYSIILWTVQELKVSNTNSICVVKYSMLHTFMTPCLHKLLRVCHEVISLIAFSHRIFKQNNCDVKYCTWKYQTILHFLCSCSYLVIFLLSSQFYWQIRLKSTAYFFDPPCTVPYNMLRQWHEGQALCMLKVCHLFPKVLFWTGRGLGGTARSNGEEQIVNNSMAACENWYELMCTFHKQRKYHYNSTWQQLKRRNASKTNGGSINMRLSSVS